MAYSTRHLIGIVLVLVLLAVVIISVTERDCACTEAGHCFCMREREELHNVSEEEIASLPEPQESQYRYFLEAWETEYEMRMEEWASLYSDFHAEEHTDEELREFNRQLARAHYEFLVLFRDRHEKFLQGLSPSF